MASELDERDTRYCMNCGNKFFSTEYQCPACGSFDSENATLVAQSGRLQTRLKAIRMLGNAEWGYQGIPCIEYPADYLLFCYECQEYVTQSQRAAHRDYHVEKIYGKPRTMFEGYELMEKSMNYSPYHKRFVHPRRKE